jgi:hypothetical protein
MIAHLLHTAGVAAASWQSLQALLLQLLQSCLQGYGRDGQRSSEHKRT